MRSLCRAFQICIRRGVFICRHANLLDKLIQNCRLFMIRFNGVVFVHLGAASGDEWWDVSSVVGGTHDAGNYSNWVEGLRLCLAVSRC
mmetsp:Transcript_16002/g.33604  ORF Transcript_16002/g.33604 Transcript_16002/m.33604 type:complete len:88 (+) Transcript_16002:13-276(+)